MKTMPTKIKSFLLHLYPELAKIKPFQDLSLLIPFPKLTPAITRTLRIALPIFVFLFVILSSLVLGQFVMSIVGTKKTTIAPVDLPTPTPTPSYQSQFTTIKRELENFNPAMPDPLYPIIDEKISLEKLPE